MVFRCVFNILSIKHRNIIKMHQNGILMLFRWYVKKYISMHFNGISMLCRYYVEKTSKFQCKFDVFSMVFWCYFDNISKKFISMHFNGIFDALSMICRKNIEIPSNNIKFSIHRKRIKKCIELHQNLDDLSDSRQKILQISLNFQFLSF